MHGDAALGAGGQQVAQADVGESAAHHHFVVAAARAVRVEVLWLHAVFLQISAGGGVGLDGAGGRDVVGGHRVPQKGQHAGAVEVANLARFHPHPFEIGRLADVGGVVVPSEALALGAGQGVPVGVALEDVGIGLAEFVGGDVGGHGFAHLGLAGPQVLHEDRIAFVVAAQGFVVEVDLQGAGQGVDHHQRRRSEVVHAHLGVDAPLEVAVAREHRSDGEIALGDGLRHRLRQGTGVADAGGAAVAHDVETQLL